MIYLYRRSTLARSDERRCDLIDEKRPSSSVLLLLLQTEGERERHWERDELE